MVIIQNKLVQLPVPFNSSPPGALELPKIIAIMGEVDRQYGGSYSSVNTTISTLS